MTGYWTHIPVHHHFLDAYVRFFFFQRVVPLKLARKIISITSLCVLIELLKLAASEQLYIPNGSILTVKYQERGPSSLTKRDPGSSPASRKSCLSRAACWFSSVLECPGFPPSRNINFEIPARSWARDTRFEPLSPDARRPETSYWEGTKWHSLYSLSDPISNRYSNVIIRPSEDLQTD